MRDPEAYSTIDPATPTLTNCSSSSHHGDGAEEDGSCTSEGGSSGVRTHSDENSTLG
jgi:hypothetical protein